MEIYSFRRWYSDSTTISELFCDEEKGRFCYVLEPTVRVGKDPRGIVAIPEGRYEITLYDSPRFKMKVPLLNGIVGHSMVEIHPGNGEFDSLDCLLPGLDKGVDTVIHSREAFGLLFARIDAALNTKSVFITIKNQGA